MHGADELADAVVRSSDGPSSALPRIERRAALFASPSSEAAPACRVVCPRWASGPRARHMNLRGARYARVASYAANRDSGSFGDLLVATTCVQADFVAKRDRSVNACRQPFEPPTIATSEHQPPPASANRNR